MSPIQVPWFAVLPDRMGGREVRRRLRASYGDLTQLNHASGNPWLVGSWAPERITLAAAPDWMVAVIGEHSVTTEWLRERVVRLRCPGGTDAIDALYDAIPGSVYLVAAHAGSGVVSVRGTASGLRRIYACAVDGLPIASSHAGVLAALRGAAADPARLATRLLFPTMPWPLGWQPVWPGIDAVRPGHCLLLHGDGTIEERRWWNPPEPELSLAEGAEALRTALDGAVRARVRPGDTVVSHLSGLDSSTVCSLAVCQQAEVVALTAAQPDAMDDDVTWARRTVRALNEAGHQVKHDVVPADECPLVYAGLLDVHDSFDEPFLYVHNRRRFQHIVDRGEHYSPRLHLMGFGGDELCAPGPAWLHTLVRTDPVAGLRAIRVAAARHRRPFHSLVRDLMRGRTYAGWLRESANRLGEPASSRRELHVGWSTPPVLPSWATRQTLRYARVALLHAAEGDPALAPDRGLHHNLAGIYSGAQVARGFLQLAGQAGVLASAPFFDDRVLSAVLSVRIGERYDPTTYKPLLLEAMRGIVPDITLQRVTKSDTSAAAVLGSRVHRDQLHGLAEASRLAELGLVDAGRLRSVCSGPIDIQTPTQRLEPTIGCETWLRSRGEDVHVHAGQQRLHS